MIMSYHQEWTLYVETLLKKKKNSFKVFSPNIYIYEVESLHIYYNFFFPENRKQKVVQCFQQCWLPCLRKFHCLCQKQCWRCQWLIGLFDLCLSSVITIPYLSVIQRLLLIPLIMLFLLIHPLDILLKTLSLLRFVSDEPFLLSYQEIRQRCSPCLSLKIQYSFPFLVWMKFVPLDIFNIIFYDFPVTT